MAYTYDPTQIGSLGKDRMRFEIGDIVRDDEEFQPYVSDEEIEAIIATGCSWRKAKIQILEAICRTLQFEVDTKVGPLSLSLGERAKRFKDMLDELKAEDASISPVVVSAVAKNKKPPYFYSDMMHNRRSDGDWRNR